MKLTNTILAILIATTCAACGTGIQQEMVIVEDDSFTDTAMEAKYPEIAAIENPALPVTGSNSNSNPIILPPPVVCGTLEGTNPCQN